MNELRITPLTEDVLKGLPERDRLILQALNTVEQQASHCIQHLQELGLAVKKLERKALLRDRVLVATCATETQIADARRVGVTRPERVRDVLLPLRFELSRLLHI